MIVCCLTALARPALPASITDLGTPGGSWSVAFGINATGYGIIDGQTHAFLLGTASTPKAGSLALLGAGLVAIGLRRWLRPP